MKAIVNRVARRSGLIAETELLYLTDQHARREVDVEGKSVQPFRFEILRIGKELTAVVDMGVCWAWTRAHARKLLSDELRVRAEWRGCDAVIRED